MKRTERHHLKDNELAQLALSASGIVQQRRNSILLVGGTLLVLLAAVGGYAGWRNRNEARAHTQLAAALAIEDARIGAPAAFATQPTYGLSFVSQRERSQAALAKYKEVADAFPKSDAGIYARYQEGTTRMALGEPQPAALAFKQVIDTGGDSIYARMARLGLAEAQAQAGEYEPAISAFQELAQRKDGDLPIDGVLIRLGRTQADAGKKADAEQTFNRLVQEFPDSPFAADAQRALEQLKKAS